MTMDDTPRFEVPLDNGDFRGDYAAQPVPPEAQAAFNDALDRAQTHYVDVAGIRPLRSAVSEFLAGLGLTVPTERVVITNGEQEARLLCLRAFLRPGRRLALPAVVDPGVRAALGVGQADTIELNCEPATGWLPSLSGIQSALDQGCRVVYLESPHRLTGFAYSAAQANAIAEVLQAYDASAVWDQSFAPAVPAEYHSLAAPAPHHTLAFGVLWPGIGLGHWHMGYVASPAPLTAEIVRLKQIISICSSAPAQWTAHGAAPAFAREHPALQRRLAGARQALLDEFDADRRLLAGQAVNVVAVDVGPAAAGRLAWLARQGLPVRDGAAFGAPDVVRVTVKPGPECVRVVHALLEGGDHDSND